MKKRLTISALLLIFLASSVSAVVINEFTVDPQTDWDNSGSTTTSDEWIELYNPLNESLEISNWSIMINDSTSNATFQSLNETIPALGYKTILKPQGGLNNDGQIIILDNNSNIQDIVSYGDWEDENSSDNAPDGNAASTEDECLSRFPNGQDTDVDSKDFQKMACTYNKENRLLSPTEQGLEAAILGKIVLTIKPRWINFGQVIPSSINNPSLNGNITFNATGSQTDVLVKITNVTGSPFDTGLKIDGETAKGKSWTILQASPVQTAVPTLNVPANAEPGPVEGTIIYTVSGPTP